MPLGGTARVAILKIHGAMSLGGRHGPRQTVVPVRRSPQGRSRRATRSPRLRRSAKARGPDREPAQPGSLAALSGREAA